MAYKFESLLSRWMPKPSVAFCIVAGFLFVQHGTRKSLNLPAPTRNVASLVERCGRRSGAPGSALLHIFRYIRRAAVALSSAAVAHNVVGCSGRRRVEGSASRYEGKTSAESAAGASSRSRG